MRVQSDCEGPWTKGTILWFESVRYEVPGRSGGPNMLHVSGVIEGRRGNYGWLLAYTTLQRLHLPLPFEGARGAGCRKQQEARDACTAAVQSLLLRGQLQRSRWL